MNSKNYLVTGNAGFIGSSLTERLLSDGHKVWGIDNLSTGFKKYIPDNSNLQFYKIDISNKKELWAYGKLNLLNIDGVFHLAAESRIQPSIHNPDLAFASNVVGTFNILQLMRELNIKNIVYSASSSSYGLKNKIPNIETQKVDILNPYAFGKYAGELLCKTWGKSYGINNVCLKYFNVYGPKSPLEKTSYPPVIGQFFKQGIFGKALTIVGDGKQRRDMTYIDDVLDANILAMKKIEENNVNGETFNIGTGKNYSINKVAALIRRELKKHGIKTKKINIDPRPGEARVTLANINKSKKYLGWEPKTNLEEKIQDLALYYLDLLR